MDAFTKYDVVMAIANKDAEMVAVALYKELFTKFGIPAQIHMDGRKEFVNKLSALLFQLCQPHQNVSGPSTMQCPSGSF
jgi:hypothetical protein